MSKVYVLESGNRARPLERLRCKDESKELQDLLEQNPQLLPSDQIDSDNPPQWLLVKREMAVADPATGNGRWSVDFLYVDHLGVPTLVECKRCGDTRSRREVIAQMLEYAANGHHYWSAEDLQAHAQDAAGGLDALNAWISRTGAVGGTASDFFEAVVANLRRAAMRLIFFLEESPNELRSLVDFLNSQLKETEVLLVEARLYDSPAGRVVVPWLFGYTEEARVAKRESRALVAGPAKERGEGAYRATLEEGALSAEIKGAIRTLLAAWPVGGQDEPGWVFGVNAIFMVPALMKTRGLFHLARNGDLQLYFGYWSPEAYGDITEAQLRFKTDFVAQIEALFGIEFSERQRRAYPGIKAELLARKLPEFISMLKGLVASAQA